MKQLENHWVTELDRAEKRDRNGQQEKLELLRAKQDALSEVADVVGNFTLAAEFLGMDPQPFREFHAFVCAEMVANCAEEEILAAEMFQGQI